MLLSSISGMRGRSARRRTGRPIRRHRSHPPFGDRVGSPRDPRQRRGDRHHPHRRGRGVARHPRGAGLRRGDRGPAPDRPARRAARGGRRDRVPGLRRGVVRHRRGTPGRGGYLGRGSARGRASRRSSPGCQAPRSNTVVVVGPHARGVEQADEDHGRHRREPDGERGVSPSRNPQARPSWMSWASSTGARAHGAHRISCQPQNTSSAPYAAKNPAVVRPIVTRPELRFSSSRRPRTAMTRPSSSRQRGRDDQRRGGIGSGQGGHPAHPRGSGLAHLGYRRCDAAYGTRGCFTFQ